MPDYIICPHCGADVPSGALACPECGSDEETGWSENAAYADLWPYDDEPDTQPATSKPWAKYLAAVLAVLVVSALLASLSPRGIYLTPLVFLAVGIVYYVTQIHPNTRRGMERQLHQNLLRKARGDRELMERLIEYERRRSPDSDRLQLLQNAIYRLERDRR